MTDSKNARSTLFENGTTLNALPNGQESDSDGDEAETPAPPNGGNT